MDEIKNKLYDEIERELDALSEINFDSEEYKVAVEGTTKLIDRAIELKKLEEEKEAKEESQKFERDFKVEQAKIENESKAKQIKRDEVFKWVEIGIAVVGIAVPTVVKVWGTNKTLKFEETGTVTTMAGKSHITSLFSRK